MLLLGILSLMGMLYIISAFKKQPLCQLIWTYILTQLLAKLFERAYRNGLWDVFKLFPHISITCPGYFIKTAGKLYENNFDFIFSFVIKITYT